MFASGESTFRAAGDIASFEVRQTGGEKIPILRVEPGIL
jgi:hypothetical protein